MAVNDRFMLPKLVRTMDQMADLLAVEQAELDQMRRTIAALEKQLTISTSTHLISRHERLFALPVNTADSLEIRRARVLAKLNAREVTTVQAICDLVKIFTGQEGEVVEHFSRYAFSVFIQLSAGNTTAHLHGLIRQIEEIKPAHLVLETIATFPSLPAEVSITPSLGPRQSESRLPAYHGTLPLGRFCVTPVLGIRSSTITLPTAVGRPPDQSFAGRPKAAGTVVRRSRMTSPANDGPMAAHKGG